MQAPLVQFVQQHHHQLLDYTTEAVATCSFLHTMLPPWDWKPDFVTVGLAEFPGAQKVFNAAFHNRYYRLLVYVVGFVALNMRSTVWRSISVQNPLGVNANAKALNGGPKPPQP